MDEVMSTCSSSAESAIEDVTTSVDLPDLHNQILQLLNTRLSNNFVMMLQEQLQLVQRSSYYMEIRRLDDQHHVSDSQLWSLIDQQRLRSLMNKATDHVRLFLTYMKLLHEEIISCRGKLADFITKYDQGLLDIGVAASMQQKLQETNQYTDKFLKRLNCDLTDLDLQTSLFPSTSRISMSQISISVIVKWPVIFDRSKCHVTSNSVYLSWEIAKQKWDESIQQFVIDVNSLHPNTSERGQFKCTSLSYSIVVSDLMPDRYYEFSVKRADAANLVYGLWSDTMTLKTSDVSKKEQNAPL